MAGPREGGDVNRARALAAAAVIMLSMAASPVASADTAPRWVLHVQRYPGGISGGVRAAASDEVATASSASAPAGSPSSSPEPPVASGGNVQLNDDSSPPMPQNETAVAASLEAPLVAVAAANDYVSNGLVVMATADGGRSWRSTRVVPTFGGTGDNCLGSDPAVAYSLRDRAFFLSQLCFFARQPFSEIHVYKSVDGGATWTPGAAAAVAASNFDQRTGTADESVFNDKELIAVDNTPTSPHYGRLYVTYTKFHMLPDGFSDYCPVQVAYTDDVPTFDPSLAVWQRRAIVPDAPGAKGVGPSANQHSSPVVEASGALDVSFVEEECNTGRDHKLLFQRSGDGAATFLPRPVRVDRPGQFVDNRDPDDLLPGKSFRAPNGPSLAYSPATGTLALAYQNLLNGRVSGADISLARSTDGGLHWADMRYVSVDPSGAPAANDQFFPAVTSDRSGTFFAIWLDNRLDPGNHLVDTFEGVSTDDGVTWTNARISTQSWDPDRGFFRSGRFIGDYIDVAASERAVYPVWTDGRDSAIDRTGIGETDIFTAVQLR